MTRRDAFYAAALTTLLAACATAPSRRAADGCWAQAYAETGYRGATTAYTGPSYESSFMTPIASLVLGPNAMLIGFSDDSYDRETVVVDPGSRIPDLGRLRFERRVASFKLDCATPTARRRRRRAVAQAAEGDAEEMLERARH